MSATNPPGRAAGRPRVRMSVEARREQILDIGVSLFSAQRVDDVSMDEVAALAKISRALVYHYFPGGQRELYLAVSRREAERLFEVTRPDPTLPPVERLIASVDAYFAYVEENPQGYLAMFKGVQAIEGISRAHLEDNLEAYAQRMLTAMAPEPQVEAMLHLAVRGWLSFMITVVLRWLHSDPRAPRREVRNLCLRVLDTSIRSVLDPATFKA